MNPDWQIRNASLGLLYADGSFRVPSAEDIFRVRFENLRSADEFPPLDAGQGGATADLKFERFPVRLRLEVLRPDHPERKLATRLLLASKRGPLAIVPANAALNGHVVVANEWFPIVPYDVEELGHLVEAIGNDVLGGITLRQLLKLRLLSHEHGIVDDRNIVGEEDTNALAAGAPSESGVETRLYPYQRTGVAWLSQLATQEVGGILADEMGLGKTIQLIAFMCRQRQRDAGPALVIGTSSILENWRREIQLFAPEFRVLVHQGAARTGFPSELKAHDVVVSSYDTVVRDAALLSQVKWNVLVADEAQFLKNPLTQRSARVRAINSRLVIASTGTPIENSLRDLWALTDLVIPGLLTDLSSFLEQFPDEPSAAARLASITAPVVLRRRLSEVAQQLPPRIEIPAALQFGEQEGLEYESLRKSIIDAPRPASLSCLMKLRLFCAHPGLVSGDLSDPLGSSMKFTRLTELLDEIFSRNEKVLIFAAFKGAVDLIAGDIRTRFNIPASAIDGRTRVELRQAIIDEFAALRGSGALVLNPRAAGAGLNIAAANHVIHYTLEWNPAVEDQATARAHRRGQTRPVTVHRLFYIDSVEEVMNGRLNRKRDLSSRALARSDEAQSPKVDILAAIQRSPVHTRSSPT